MHYTGAIHGTPAPQETSAALTPRAANRIRMASFGALTMLIIQFVLGTAYSLYGTAPASGKSVGMFSSPLLAVHVIMGILIIVAAVMLVVRAVQARHRPTIATTVIGPAGDTRRLQCQAPPSPRTAATARRLAWRC